MKKLLIRFCRWVLNKCYIQSVIIDLGRYIYYNNTLFELRTITQTRDINVPDTLIIEAKEHRLK